MAIPKSTDCVPTKVGRKQNMAVPKCTEGLKLNEKYSRLVLRRLQRSLEIFNKYKAKVAKNSLNGPRS